jgi:hypothetical protein
MVILRPISEDELQAIPEIPASSLAKFEAEIERDRAAGRLVKLGDTPKEAVAKLKRLNPDRVVLLRRRFQGRR